MNATHLDVRGACGASLEDLSVGSPQPSSRFDVRAEAQQAPPTTTTIARRRNISRKTEETSMGGIGSGRWPSLFPEFTDDVRRINVKSAPALGLVLVHRWDDGGAVRLIRRSASQVELNFVLGGAPVHAEIRLDVHRTECAAQDLWLCTICSARRRDLFLTSTGAACRTCLGLRYRTQYLTKVERAGRRVDDARAALGLAEDAGLPRRPHRRWRRTHERQCRALNAAERQLDAAVRSDLEALKRWAAQLRRRGGGA
jgi:hypothetical protein